MSSSCDPLNCSLSGSSVHGILQARILEWVGCHFLLKGNLLTQKLNPGLPHCGHELRRKPMSQTEFQSYLMQVIHMDSEAKSAHLFLNKIVLIILMDLDNYFNILFMSRTEVLTFGRRLNGKRKSMAVEFKHHNIL